VPDFLISTTQSTAEAGDGMELSLQTYFDLGVSYGLGDSAFAPLQDLQGQTVPDILGIGISNPLGLGRTGQLTDATVSLWRQASVDKVDAPEMELGFEGSTAEFPDAPATFEEYKSSLKSLIATHAINTHQVTVYAIGVVFLRLDFVVGVPLPLANGLRRCFEFAGYSEGVSRAILQNAHELANRCLRRTRSGWWWVKTPGTSIATLSRRPPPEVETDDKGYRELRLFPGFTCIALCTDAADDVDAIKQRLLPKSSDGSSPSVDMLEFEYHGVIHFNWGVCFVQPRNFDKPDEPPERQIRRMLMCIQIAHTFQAAGEAFNNLFVHETRVDAEGFIRGEAAGLDYIQLNRLRTLALAVIGLTKFKGVTQTEEDQAYFAAYDRYAELDELHSRILDNSEVLATVQKGESELEQERRDDWLNTAVIFLTGFTMLTVLKDIYEFLKSEDIGVGSNLLHNEVATAISVLLITILLILRHKVVHRRSRRR
jgi:hypothetical protein